MLFVWIGELMNLWVDSQKMKVLVVILMFFVISALMIISNNDLAMLKKGNIEKFSESYVIWINQIYLNFQILTGDIVKLDWLPK